MFERALGFSEYVALYGLARSEGLLLRYLTDAYRGLVQSVPEDTKTDELIDITEWLGELVRQVDSSLLDEWEALAHPDQSLVELDVLSSGPAAAAGPVPTAVTANTRAFTVMVRNAAFRHVELLARRDFAGLGDLDGAAGWDAARWRNGVRRVFRRARQRRHRRRRPLLSAVPSGSNGRKWQIIQTLDDPDGQPRLGTPPPGRPGRLRRHRRGGPHHDRLRTALTLASRHTLHSFGIRTLPV